MRKTCFFLAFLVIIFLSGFASSKVQGQEAKRSIDMMILIDNSCSMFPKNMILSGCTSWGSDPNFLRISGADLFIARLGFAEVNKDEYQVGIIGIGAGAKMISSLQPVQDLRDSLAVAIANPAPEGQTQVLPALKAAYNELRTSLRRKATNLPAVVLITDGVPWPPEGQSNEEIASALKSNPDIPVFIILLQSEEQRTGEYASYIKFWQKMESETKHIFVYKAENADQIETTYNTIIAQLQNTIPSRGTTLEQGQPLQIFVSQYVQKIVVTIIHSQPQYTGTVTILDPNGAQVTENQPGIGHFRGKDNPVEVISIAAPRLNDALKKAIWTISSDEKVVVFLDREGAFRLNFLSPEVSLTDVSNVYRAIKKATPNQDLSVRFKLVMDDGSSVLDKQPLQGTIYLPDGTSTDLRISTETKPDEAGIYDIKVNFANLYPSVVNEAARFVVEIKAGTADENSTERIPIASARLLVDAGPGPYIAQVLPSPVECRAGELTSSFTVKMGDLQTTQPDSIQARIFGQSTEVALDASGADQFHGDIFALCAPLLSQVACSAQGQASFQLRVTGRLRDGSPISTIDTSVPVITYAPACTPTSPPPTPTSPPTPVPPATPIPDSDIDQHNDQVDLCIDQPAWPWLDFFNGCPPPILFLVLLALLGLGLLAFLVFWGWPWFRVSFINKPPKCYLHVCRKGKPLLQKHIHNVGYEYRTDQVKIGGSKKLAHILVPGLKDIEFVVLQRNNRVELVDYPSMITRLVVTDNLATTGTSDTDISLRISLKLDKLRCS